MTDEGGESPCWAHLFDDEAAPETGTETIVDLTALDVEGRAGAVWSLPHGGDLDVNFVHLNPADVIGSHVNSEVDVLISPVAGSGALLIDDALHELQVGVLAMIPKGRRREVRAGAAGVTYLSIHRRRLPLSISSGRRGGSDGG